MKKEFPTFDAWSRNPVRVEGRDHIGASEVGAVLGASPYATPMEVWSRKVGLADEFKGNKATERGQFMEPAILRWTATRMEAEAVCPGIPLEEPSIAHPDFPHMACHPDGALRVGGEEMLVEIKTARYDDGWGEEGSDEIPLHYLAQVQVQMFCTGYDKCVVAAFITTKDELRLYFVKADPETQLNIAQRVEAWYQRHVVKKIAPEVDGSDASKAYLLSQHPQERAPLRQASEDEAAMIARLVEIRAQMKALEDERDTVQNMICKCIGDSEGVQSAGIKMTWKLTAGRESIDSKKLKAEHPEVYAAVTKHGEPTRMFRVYGEKKREF